MSDQKTSGSSPAAISMDNAAARQKIEAEYHSKKPVWPRYYKEICEKCDREAKEQQFCTSESERHQNRGLNRYRDVNPYDHSRIILKRGSVDYINANLVKMERAARQYILTQGPLEDTVGHFWLMVWEQASSAILMLNKLMEKKQIKCHLYWPNELGADKALKLPHVKLTVELVRCETYQNFVRRWFKLTDLETHQSREVLQFHYTTWPDFGIPGSPDAFLKFLQQVRDSGCLSRDVGPAVVHCSAGIGRSGTFCLVDCCLVLIDQYGECNVSKVLCELRSYRMGLIQTADQLDFSYQAIIEGIQKLHDPTFLDAEEPTISNDTDTNHHTLDELPPPLPRRVASLILPLAPNSGGVLSLDMRAAQANGAAGATGELIIGELSSKDALNNIINHPHDIIRDAEVADRLRPLPPLPSVRDANDDTDSDDGDDDDDYSLEDIEDDDEDEEEEYETINDEDHDAEPVNGQVPIPTTTTQAADDVNANNEKPAPVSGKEISSKANGIDTIPGQQLPASPENELKRRKRNEYQASLEQKVNDIKRKQREGEDSQVAAKKRRSLLTYIAAGVVVGVICAYAYTKLG